MPPFDLQGGAALAVARGIAVIGLLSAFGTIVFRVLVAPKAYVLMQPDGVAASKSQLRLLAQASIAAAMAGLGVWLVTQAALMADADTVGGAFSALLELLTKTTFGHVILLQYVALLLLAAATIVWRDTPGGLRASLALITVALALQSGHSHAFAMQSGSMQSGLSLLLVCDVLHLAGAGGWLGGLVPLLLMVRSAPPKAAATAARWFSPLGQASIAALVVSAMVQGWVLVATVPGLIGTAYGWMILTKLALFGVLGVFAWFNRYRFAPALLRGDAGMARRVLLRSIALQTVVAVAIVAAAIVLSELPPAMHLQPLWPFSQRPSLAAVYEDPEFRREVLLAGAALAASMAVLALALVLRRGRLVAIGLALLVARLALPHLDVLLVKAYPTSFYHSPTGFSAASIVGGQALYAGNCVSCHGRNGAGDGALAKHLPVPPADLTAAHLWMHSDGELFWWISHGMVTPEGTQVMPGFAATLDEDARWALIDYIRAHNAGNLREAASTRDDEDRQQPVKGADFGVRCGDRELQLFDLRGKFVRLVFGSAPQATPSGVVTTILVSPPESTVTGDTCIAQDETIAPAYAILSGVSPAALSGSQILLDAQGWLRAWQPADAASSWNDPKALSAEIMKLREHRIVVPGAQVLPMKMPMDMPM